MCSSLSEGLGEGKRERGNCKVHLKAKTGGSDGLVGELLKYGGYERVRACTVSMAAEV